MKKRGLLGSCSLKKQPSFRNATTGSPAKLSLKNERRNSIMKTRHYTDLGNASDWSCHVGNLLQPIRSHYPDPGSDGHQYGISALVSKTSFRGKQRWRGEMSAVFLGYGSCALKYFNLQKFEHLKASFIQSLICKRERNGKFLLIRS